MARRQREVNNTILNKNIHLDYVEFRTSSFKSWGIQFALVITAMLTVFCVSIAIVAMNLWLTLIVTFPFLLILFIIQSVRSNTVRFGPDYIQVITIFKKKTIFISDVNKFGIFFFGSNRWPKVTSQSKIDDQGDALIERHFIYLTKNTEFDLDCFKPMKHIYFPYRRDFYFRVKEMIEPYGI